MVEELENILKDATLAISNACTIDELDKLKLTFLGKKGIVTELFKKIGDLNQNDRKDFASKLNSLKIKISEIFEKKLKAIAFQN